MQIIVTPEEVAAFEKALVDWHEKRFNAAIKSALRDAGHRLMPDEADPLKRRVQASVDAFMDENPKPALMPKI